MSDKKLLFSLPEFYEIAVRVTHVAANLELVFFWLGEEFSPSLLPLFIIGPDVRYTYNHEVTGLVRVQGVYGGLQLAYRP